MQALARLVVFALCAALVSGTSLAKAPHSTGTEYTHTTPTRDGIGKHYFGREIAQVMGHRGAS